MERRRKRKLNRLSETEEERAIRIEKKKKKISQDGQYVFKIKFITIKDYDELNPYDAILYDKRSFFQLFYDRLKKDHVLFNLFFYDSIMDPLCIRIVMFYLSFSITFMLNAFFFSDDYIDARSQVPLKESVNTFYFLYNPLI